MTAFVGASNGLTGPPVLTVQVVESTGAMLAGAPEAATSVDAGPKGLLVLV